MGTTAALAWVLLLGLGTPLSIGIIGAEGKAPGDFLSLSKSKLTLFKSKLAQLGSSKSDKNGNESWTRWYSRSVPVSHKVRGELRLGDSFSDEIESRRLLWPPVCNGYKPLEAECRVLESGLVWDPLLDAKIVESNGNDKLNSAYYASYPSNASCTADHGAICIGDKGGNCPDILIRFRCPTDVPSKEDEVVSLDASNPSYPPPEYDWATDRLGPQYDQMGRPGYPCETKTPSQCIVKNGRVVAGTASSDESLFSSSSWREDLPVSSDCWRYAHPRACSTGHSSFAATDLRESWLDHQRYLFPNDQALINATGLSSLDKKQRKVSYPFKSRDLSFVFPSVASQGWPAKASVRIVTLINEFDSNFGSLRYLIVALKQAGAMEQVDIDICYLQLSDPSLPDFIPPSAAKASNDPDLQSRIQNANRDILPDGNLPLCNSDFSSLARAHVTVVAGFGYHKDRKWMQTYGNRNPLLAVRTLRAAGASAIAYLRLADEYCTTSCMPPDQICVRTSRDRPAGLSGRCFGGFEPDDCERVDSQFRVYYDHRFEGVKLPMPLGFGHIWPFDQSKFDKPPGNRTLPLNDRTYLFNFIGSLTNPVRQKIVQILKNVNNKVSPDVPQGKIHLVGGWSGNYDKSHGYIAPHEYKEILEKSILTISPAGHQWECHRWYEAIDAGSVLVLSLDEAKHTKSAYGCGDASVLLRYLDIPAVFIRSWEEDLGKLLLQVANELQYKSGRLLWEGIRRFVEEWNQQYVELVGRGFMHSLRQIISDEEKAKGK